MSGKTHRLPVGDITCIVLHEGAAPPRDPTPDDVARRFPNATESEITDALQSPGQSSMNALYIESDGTRIVVDAGMGQAAQPNFGHIPAALEAEGIRREDIDLVFITHFHGDHINGLIKPDGMPTFPNSRVVTAQAEWEHWMSEATLATLGDERAAALRRIFDSLQDRLSFAHVGDGLAPGVTLVDLAGHTPGHTGLLIESLGARLLDVVDLLHSVAQFKFTHWHFAFDTDGELAEQNRKAALGRAADEELLTLFYHLPFPGLGHVTRSEDGAFAYWPV